MDHWRQLDLLSPKVASAAEATIIGVGGIGSPTALALAKMGIGRLILIDPDVVEDHNLPTQLYRLEDIGRPKVEALAEQLTALSEAEVRPFQERITPEGVPAWRGRLSGVVIAAVDSMAARAAIWQAVRLNPKVKLFIDGRMGAEVARIFTIEPLRPAHARAYEATLVPDEETVQEPCTARAIVYNTFGIASLITAQVKRHLRGEEWPFEIILDYATLTLIERRVFPPSQAEAEVLGEALEREHEHEHEHGITMQSQQS